MDKKTKIKIGALAGLLVVIAIGVAYYIYTTHQRLAELTEQYEIEKEELEEEYSQLAIQYEGYKLNVNNDSLIDKLENERLKVQRLVEELKTVKATNARRINELKKELATVRAVLRSYVAQVDSLNRLNQQLQEENKEIHSKYQAERQTSTQLKKDKENLTQKVTLASKLDAVAISVEAQNKRGKQTNKINKAEKIKISFTIAKNVTAQVGDKDIYVRIMKPDGDPLVKNRNDLFRYEDREISYSIRRQIEYTGEEVGVTMYWTIEEYLSPGTYRVDIFADGNLIGKKEFALE
jgi:DNA repair exonuclease SbcCD ATPase subunit